MLSNLLFILCLISVYVFLLCKFELGLIFIINASQWIPAFLYLLKHIDVVITFNLANSIPGVTSGSSPIVGQLL